MYCWLRSRKVQRLKQQQDFEEARRGFLNTRRHGSGRHVYHDLTPLSSVLTAEAELERYGEFSMQDEDLEYHLHRIYFGGCNTFSLPFQLAPLPEPPIQAIVQYKEYQQFSRQYTFVAKWDRWEAYVYYILCILYFPFAPFWLAKCRTKHILHLLKCHLKYDHGFLKDYQVEY